MNLLGIKSSPGGVFHGGNTTRGSYNYNISYVAKEDGLGWHSDSP